LTSLAREYAIANRLLSGCNLGFPMAIGPIEVIRQATPEQCRTLFASAMDWGLDAVDAMLYSLELAMLVRVPSSCFSEK
jgi:hypothetical protein